MRSKKTGLQLKLITYISCQPTDHPIKVKEEAENIKAMVINQTSDTIVRMQKITVFIRIWKSDICKKDRQTSKRNHKSAQVSDFSSVRFPASCNFCCLLGGNIVCQHFLWMHFERLQMKSKIQDPRYMLHVHTFQKIDRLARVRRLPCIWFHLKIHLHQAAVFSNLLEGFNFVFEVWLPCLSPWH